MARTGGRRMNREDVRKELIDVLENVLQLDDLKLTDDITAKDVEGWDSLSHIRIMVSLERKFKIRFSNAELEKLKSIGELIDHVNSKLSAW
jgi:acyl carrier protein